MFRSDENSDVGYLSILFAQAQEPLALWDKRIGTSSKIKRIFEESEGSKLQCIEMTGNNVSTTFITTPPPGTPSLGIRLPILVLIVKNLKRYFTYQVLIRDDLNLRRRFRMTNIPGLNRRLPTMFTFPIILEEGWNELAANLAELCARVYGTKYVETIRVEIHPNCRLREVFFCERPEAMQQLLSKPLKSSVPAHHIRVDSDINKNNNNNEMDGFEKELTGAYEKLATAVKSGRIVARQGDPDSPSTIHNENSDGEHGGKTSNLGARLKMSMYFEKPADPRASSSSHSPSSSSRKASKDRKK